MRNVPKPTTGYIVVSSDWNPAKQPAHGWNPRPTLKEAQADLEYADMVGAKQVILKVQTTYALVEDGHA